jgi:hypothetical protein
VDRRLVPSWPPDDAGFSRVALLPPGTSEWVDGTALPGGVYEYSVQALGPRAGSAPSAAAGAARAAVPETLAFRVERGTSRFVPDWFDGTSRVRLRGTLRPGPLAQDGALDPVAGGILWTVEREYGPGTLLEIPPADPGWSVRRGRLRWTGGFRSLVLDPATGRFEFRAVEYGWFAHGGDVLGMRLTIGREAGTATTEWQGVTHYRARIAPPGQLR